MKAEQYMSEGTVEIDGTEYVVVDRIDIRRADYDWARSAGVPPLEALAWAYGPRPLPAARARPSGSRARRSVSMRSPSWKLRLPVTTTLGMRSCSGTMHLHAIAEGQQQRGTAALPLDQRVAQGGNGVKCGRCNGAGDECPCCRGTGLPTGHCEVCTPLDRQTSADALAWRATHRLNLAGATYRVDERVDGRWPVCGPRRNRRMLRAEKPALVLAYPTPGSKGTWSCIEEARRLDVPVLVWIHWAANSDASRIVTHALQARGVRLAGPTAVCGPRALLGKFDRDEHRVLVGLSALAAALPEGLHG